MDQSLRRRSPSLIFRASSRASCRSCVGRNRRSGARDSCRQPIASEIVAQPGRRAGALTPFLCAFAGTLGGCRPTAEDPVAILPRRINLRPRRIRVASTTAATIPQSVVRQSVTPSRVARVARVASAG
jgi:hypothetical protein